MAEVKFRGVAFFMNGREYIVPSLSLRHFQDNYELLTTPPVDLREQFSLYIPVIGLALRRNYPEISDEELKDMLDLSSFRDALVAVQGASGMKTVAAGEATPQT